MFGYVMLNARELGREDKERYRAHYCGLCRALGSRAGNAGRATLTYDMTFLALLLSALYEPEEEQGTLRCPANPLRQCGYVHTAATDYAADMNLLLAYYQALDDARDEQSARAARRAGRLEGELAGIRQRWPGQCRAVEESLEELAALERAGELNPDLPANAFGRMMGGLFRWREDEKAGPLARMGEALGRFIYLMDARLDLRQDILKERYNPLVAQPGRDFTPLLTLLIGECCQYFEELSPARDLNILRNILYSGVWVKYQTKLKTGEGRA